MSRNRKLRATAAMLGAAAMLWTAPSAGELIVEKDAAGLFTRTYAWTISKTASVPEVNLPIGASQDVYYTITFTKDAGTDINFVAFGGINMSNKIPPPPPGGGGPPPTQYLLWGLSDVVGGTYPALFLEDRCNTISRSDPYLLLPGAQLLCTYVALLPGWDGADTSNEVTVEGIDLLSGLDITLSASADVIFGDPTTLINNSITVVDVAEDGVSRSETFTDSGILAYMRTFGPYQSPFSMLFDNTVTITETGQFASAVVRIEVVPEPGTLALLGLGLAGLAAARQRKQ